MRKRVGAGIVAVAAAAGTFAIAGPAGSAAPRGTMSLYEHDTSQTQIDLGDKGAGPGDQFVFAGDVFDRKGGTKLGRAGGSCTTASPTETFCTVLLKLRGGQIVSEGFGDTAAIFGGKTVASPIIGGSGKYRHARGYMSVRVPPDVPNLTDAYFVVHLG
jgi:hypothetical protein